MLIKRVFQLKKWIASLLFVCLNLVVHGQERRFDRFDVSKGLSQNLVFDMDIDQKGNVWAATSDGLNRYNGYDFTVFKTDEAREHSIVGSIATSVKVDHKGDVWILTFEGGLNKYDAKRNVFINYPDSILISSTRQLFNDIHIVHDTSIWINSENSLCVFNKNTGKFHSTVSGTVINGIAGTDNAVYCYGLGGVQKLECSSRGDIRFKTVFPGTVFWMSAENEGFYIATKEGFVSYDKTFHPIKTLIAFDHKDIPFNLVDIEDILVSPSEIWIGTMYGLFHSNYHDLSKNLLPEQNVVKLKYDKAGNLWIGTSIGGVLYYGRDKNQFKHYRINEKDGEDLPFIRVNSICKLKNEELWYGLNGTGIRVLKKDGSTKAYRHYLNGKNQEVPFNSVRCIFEDSRGTIWIGTDNLCRYNKRLDRIETINHTYPWSGSGDCFSIKEFEKGKVMLSSGKEMAELDLETGALNVFPDHRNGVYLWYGIRDMVKDKYGNYWIVQNTYGLVKIAPDFSTFKRYITSNSDLPDNIIHALQPQGDSLWIASNTGLYIMNIQNDRIVKSYRKEDGLSDNVISSVHLVDNAEIWMSTGKGISKLDIETEKITTFLNDEYYSRDAYHFHDDGELFYGSYAGITSFYPDQIKDLTYVPTPFIEKFLLFNTEINLGDTVNGKVIWETDEKEASVISLNYKQNSISFTFNSFPYYIPKTHTYRYRLNDGEAIWNYPEKENRTVTFNSLHSGEYIFQLEVSSRRGEWSKPAQIYIVIKPPFWNTIAFRILLVLLALLGFATYLRVRTAKIKRSNITLQKKVEEQTKELVLQNKQIKHISEKLHQADQAKLRFFTDVSHEFRTPIALILGHLDSITKGVNSKSAKVISNNAHRLLKLVNDLIEVRKIDQGHSKLNVSLFDMVGFTKNITDSFRILAEQKKISIAFFSERPQCQVWLDKNKMEHIVFNLISNAIKYIPNERNIIVQLQILKTEIEITVGDNGPGIPADQLKNIFNRYHQLGNASLGHGIGLSLVKDLVHLQKGSIKVRSEVDKGTTFSLRFKLGKDHFHAKDFGAAIKQTTPQVTSTEINLKNVKFVAGKKILLVEDNPDLQNYLFDLLQNYFNVEVAANGKIALDKLSGFVPDLIISDIMMPVMDGLKLCAELKSNLAFSTIPLILLTAKTNPESQIDAFTYGADDYVEKPFNPNVLLARINALLVKAQHLRTELQTSNAKVSIKPSTFNKSDYELWVKINKVIEENYHDVDFGKDAIVEALNISLSTLQRRFKKLTGQSVATYLRKYRLKKAFDLLYDDDMDMIQLSLKSGFKSISQFRINFKAEFGKTPAEFRKMK